MPPIRHQEPPITVQPALPPTAELRRRLSATRGGLAAIDDAGLWRIWEALSPEAQRELLSGPAPAPAPAATEQESR